MGAARDRRTPETFVADSSFEATNEQQKAIQSIGKKNAHREMRSGRRRIKEDLRAMGRLTR